MTRSDPTDEAAFGRAIAEARSGGPVGFEWLWNRFSRQVAGFARLRGSDDPDGLTNDVFAAAFRSIGAFEGDTNSFVNFVFAIARNKLIDEQRRRRRRVITTRIGPEHERSGGNVELDAFAGLDPETARALATLSSDQQEVLFLRLVADRSIDDVARLTGRSPGAVKSMQHRALASMKREISRGAVSR